MSSLSTNGRTSYRLQSSCVAPPASGRARPRGGVSLGSSAPSEGRTAMGPDPPKCAESPEKDTRRRRRSARLLLKKRALDESNLPDIVRDVVRRRPPPAARPPPDSTEPGHRVSTPAAGEGDVSVRHLLPAPENVAGDSDQEGWVWQCRFHPFRSKLALALDDGRVHLLSSSHAAPVSRWNDTRLSPATGHHIWKMDWSADGTKLAAGCAHGAVVCWLESGVQAFESTGRCGAISCLRWNQDRALHLFLTGSLDGVVLLWDSTTGSVLRRMKVHPDWVVDVCWISADTFASCSTDPTIVVSRFGSDAPVRRFSHQDSVYALLWNGHESVLASCSNDGSIKMWTLDRAEAVKELRSIGASPVGCFDWYQRIGCVQELCDSFVACGSKDGRVVVWNLKGETPERPRILPRLVNLDAIKDVAFSSDGRLLAAVDCAGKLVVWQMLNGETIVEYQVAEPFFKCLSWDASGQILAVANQSLDVTFVEFECYDD